MEEHGAPIRRVINAETERSANRVYANVLNKPRAARPDSRRNTAGTLL